MIIDRTPAVRDEYVATLIPLIGQVTPALPEPQATAAREASIRLLLGVHMADDNVVLASTDELDEIVADAELDDEHLFTVLSEILSVARDFATAEDDDI